MTRALGGNFTQPAFLFGVAWDDDYYFYGALVLLVVLVALVRILLKLLPPRTSTSTVPFPDWISDQPWESLKKVFTATLNEGQAALKWYHDNIRVKRLGSQIIRFLAIALASIGALMPLMAAVLKNIAPSQKAVDAEWGYISFAAAAVLLAADKFYGFSSGWVRYLKTQMALESALSDLRYDWTALVAKVQNSAPTPDEVQIMLQKMKEFVDFVHAQVRQETEAWILEFQTSLSELMTSVKAQSETAKPGSIQVIVNNSAAFDSVTVILDQTSESAAQGGQCLFPSIAPGVHALLVRGNKAGKIVPASDVVKVSAGAMATVTLTLSNP